MTIAEKFYCDDGATCAAGHYNNAVTDLAVTNNSTLAYPSVIARKAKPDYEAVGNSYTMEVVAFNRFAMAGKPVARVEYSCADEGAAHTVTGSATQMTVSSYGADQHAVLVYAATLDFTTLNDNNTITCNTKIYPWVGDSTSIVDTSTLGISMPDARFTSQIVFKAAAGTYKGGFAVVDETNGTDTTNVDCDGAGACTTCVFNTRAAAEAAANTCRYKYIGNALSAIKTFNNTAEAGWTTHNDPGNGTVILVEGTHNSTTKAPGSGLGAQTTWATISPFTGATKANVIFAPGTNNTNLNTEKLKLSGLQMTSSVIGAFYINTTNSSIWWHDCNINLTGNPPILNHRIAYATYNNITALTSGFVQQSSYKVRWSLIRGNTSSVAGGTSAIVYSILGNNGIKAGVWMDQSNAGSMEISDGGVYAYNSLYGQTAAWATCPGIATAGGGVGLTPSIGIAIVQNITESITNSIAMMAMYHDATLTESNHVLLWHNTVAGNRINFGYNDGTNTEANKHTIMRKHLNWSIIGNIFDQVATKDDVFNVAFSKSIASTTRGNPTTLAISSHGLSSTNVIYISGAASGEWGTLLNGKFWTITSTGAGTVTIPVDTTLYTADCAANCGTASGEHYNRTGGWAHGYRVGDYGNLVRSTIGSDPWYKSWQGEFDGLDTIFGTAPIYLNDASYYVSGAGNGNYHIRGDFPALNLIPANKNVLPYDLDGMRRRSEADDPGAYTRGLGKMF